MIHTPTLFIVMIALSLVLAGAISWVGHRSHTERFVWAAGLVLQAVAYTLFALRGEIPDGVSIVLGNVALASSFALYTTGLLHFRGIRWPMWWTWGPVAVVAVTFWVLIDQIGPRLIAGALLIFLQSLLLIASLLHQRQAPLLRGGILITAGASVMALLMLLRIWAVSSGAMRIQFVTDGGWMQGLTFLLAVMSTLLFAIGLLIMSEERAEDALQQGERFQAYRSHILERMAAGAPLSDVLTAITRGIDTLRPGLCCHIALAETAEPVSQTRSMDTKAEDGTRVHNIVSPGGEVLGRVTLSVPAEWPAEADDKALLAESALLASLAIERSRSEQQRLAAQALIHEQALHDPLTQLPNRRLLVNNLNLALAAHRRNGHVGALMFLDLDNFKPLNDRHGHAVGDLLLIEVAQRLRQHVREMDTVARFGGDEFVVLLSDLGADAAVATEQAQAAAQKLSQTLAEPYLLAPATQAGSSDCVTHRCTASIGLLLFNGGTGTPDALLESADAAMYQAKQAGRNRVHFVQAHSPTAA